MTLEQYLETLATKADKAAFAQSVGTTLGYLKHVVKGRRSPSGALAIEIERETNGLVRCEELCPDADWDYIRRSVSAEQTNAA